MRQEAQGILYKFWVKWRILRLLKSLLLLLSGMSIGAILITLIAPDFYWYQGMVALLILGLFIVGLYHKKTFSTQRELLISQLNERYSFLQYSTELLWDSDKELNRLERMQVEVVANALIEEKNQLKTPFALGRYLLLLLGSCLLTMLYFNVEWLDYSVRNQNKISQIIKGEASVETAKSIASRPLKLKKQAHNLRPPAYSGIAPSSQNTAAIIALEGTAIDWAWTFDQAVEQGELLLHNGQKIPLIAKGKQLSLTNFILKEKGFYSISFKGKGQEIQHSDYHKLEVRPDEAPSIKVEKLEQYKAFSYDTTVTISIRAKLKDDFGVGKIRLITTVSKGIGEGVKFKNDTLAMLEEYISAKEKAASKTLSLHQLGLGPGDELYFHVEAEDNKRPYPNITRTHKFINVYEDTARIELDVSGSLSVSLLPEYFRSQRQIIIDTERLLAAKAKLPPTDFNNQSENIGADQKLLRLRYGKFLGEESVTEIGPSSAHGEEDHDHDHDGHQDHAAHDHEEESHDHDGDGHEDHAAHDHEEESHDHDHDGHEGHAAHDHEEEDHDHDGDGHQDHAAQEHEGGGHDHDHGSHEANGDGTENQNPLAAYSHNHDHMEEATYFDSATKAKLRAALNFMWDAELQLRLHFPEKALPHEYKALKLIKEIQQASRVYVQRAGFDPPVIKVEEKRLTGELDKIQETSDQKRVARNKALPNIEKAIPILESLQRNTREMTSTERQTLQAAGNELSGIAIQQPGRFLKELGQLRALLDRRVEEQRTQLTAILAAFIKVLPNDQEAQRKPRMKSRLSRIYLDKIGNL